MQLAIEQHQKRLELYKLGMDDTEIAERVGVSSPSTICRWRNRHGLPNIYRSCSMTRALPPEKWEPMREFLRAVSYYRPKDVGGFMKAWREVGGAAKY